jgi:hypothetical protein
MVPGAKFSSSTSARRTIVRSSSRPRSVFKLSVADSLFELSIAKGSAAPPTLARRRRCSPPLGSILITRAPAIAIRKVA